MIYTNTCELPNSSFLKGSSVSQIFDGASLGQIPTWGIVESKGKHTCNFACCCYSVAKLYPTLCNPRTTARQASLCFTISRSLFKLMSVESVMPSNHLILCPLLLLPSILTSIRVFSNESALCRWPKFCQMLPNSFQVLHHFAFLLAMIESIEGVLFSPCLMACGILVP